MVALTVVALGRGGCWEWCWGRVVVGSGVGAGACWQWCGGRVVVGGGVGCWQWCWAGWLSVVLGVVVVGGVGVGWSSASVLGQLRVELAGQPIGYRSSFRALASVLQVCERLSCSVHGTATVIGSKDLVTRRHR